MFSLYGAGIGRGIEIGQAYVLKSQDIDSPEFSIAKDQISAEIKRFESALKATEKQYRANRRQLPKDSPPESAAFINAHLLMLRDPLLVTESKKIIRQELINAEHALTLQSNNLVAVFEKMQDAYLRNKKSDVKQITNRILRNLLNLTSHNLSDFKDEDLSGRIVVGKELSPTEALVIKDRHVRAFVTDLGSQISHTAIMARSLRMPAVVGLHGSTKYINEDDLLIVDGKRGIIIVAPDQQILKEYKQRQRAIDEREKQLSLLTDKTSKTHDGKHIQLLANIDSTRDLRNVKKANAAGVGLYRTEYLFMERDHLPTEQEQFKAYKQIVTKLDKPVVIRTLDVGGDKQLSFDYPQKNSSQSPLGLRAVRLCLNNMDIFKPQLRAILKTSAFGKVSILVPMVSNLDEVNQILYIIQQTKLELKKENVAFDSRIKVGGMIEVPAAAIMAEQFAKKLDFLSIGTNDLIQYTLAIDRVDDAVNYLYDPIHPAVLRLIRHVIQAGKKASIPVSLCGEMAGNIRYTRLLLTMGLTEFSMDATYLLDVKNQVLNAEIKKYNYQVKQILKADDPSQARDRLARLNQI